MIQTHSKTTHHVKPSRKKIEPSRRERERFFKTLAQDCHSKALRRRQAALVDSPENARRLNVGRDGAWQRYITPLALILDGFWPADRIDKWMFNARSCVKDPWERAYENVRRTSFGSMVSCGFVIAGIVIATGCKLFKQWWIKIQRNQTHSKTTHRVKPSRKKIEPSAKTLRAYLQNPPLYRSNAMLIALKRCYFKERHSMNESYNADALKMPDRG